MLQKLVRYCKYHQRKILLPPARCVIIIENAIKYEMLGTITTDSPLLDDWANNCPLVRVEHSRSEILIKTQKESIMDVLIILLTPAPIIDPFGSHPYP